jgi:hypothetical protein
MITTRQDLANFCLRQLGGGVVNIEVSNEQLEDAIELAIQYYNEYHFDGIERDFVKHKVTATTLLVADATNFEVNQVITGQTSLATATILEKNGNTLTIGKMSGDTHLSNTEVIQNANLDSTTITTVTEGTMDLGYIDMPDPIVSVVKVINLTNVLTSTDYMFNAQYQMMLSEIQNIAAAQTQYLYGVMNYMSHLDFILRKEKTFRFNRRQNKVFLDINWAGDVKIGDYLVIEVYKALDDTTYGEMLNDVWLKKYATAQVKKVWGSNLRKYTGMTLPGGLTYNGQQIYDEAVAEIKELEQEATNNSAPLFFEIG